MKYCIRCKHCIRLIQKQWIGSDILHNYGCNYYKYHNDPVNGDVLVAPECKWVRIGYGTDQDCPHHEDGIPTDKFT